MVDRCSEETTGLGHDGGIKTSGCVGIPAAEALPQDSAPELSTLSSVVCRAETLWNGQKESAMERFATKRKTKDVQAAFRDI